jgi:hypothetical protein
MIRRTVLISLVSMFAALAAPTSACAAWWTANYAPAYRTTVAAPAYAYYAPPTTAYYAPTTAYYAPRTAYYGAQTAYYGVQTAYAPVATACTRQVCSYVPQTSYQAMYRAVPVTTYHPVTTVDHYSGCTWTGYRPVTQTVQQAYYVPVTSYRPVYSTVSIAMSPVCAAPVCTACAAPACAAPATAAAYVAPAAVAPPVAAPPASSCCGSSSPVPAGQPVQPIPQGPNGSSIPAPAIDPNTAIPNANGQGLSSEQQSRETARPQYNPPYNPQYNPSYSRPAETKAQPTFVLPRNEAPRDKVAVGGYGAQAVYSPASWAPSTGSATRVDTSGWKAAD